MREEILRVMDKNARITVTDLATILDTPEEEISREITDMEREKIIYGYHTMIDWDRTNDEHVLALIEVRVTPQRDQGFDAVAERIYRFDEVSSVYLMSGAFDLMVIVEGKTMKEVALFVARRLAVLDYVLSTSTNFVLKKYKENGMVLADEKKDERIIVSA
ncbi:MAG: Lrp/AsnC family transcriptional regulator [Clostridiales bacterium]|nr:Lrp/AsnC family transcriptional regulator [Clostridiales bacterium]